MLFYDFATLDDFIKNNLISNIEEEKISLHNIINLFIDKKNNLLAVTNSMINITNAVSKDKLNNFHDTVALLKSSFEKIEELESFSNSLLYSLDYVSDLYKKDPKLNYNEIKAELIEYNKKRDELTSNILTFEKDIDNIINSAIELSNPINNSNPSSIKKEDFRLLNDLTLLKDNDVLIISEKDQLAYLPYKSSEVKKIFKNANGKYASFKDVIDDLYIVSLNKFKNSTISRFRESFNLIRNKEKGSIVKALDLGLELMFKYDLNPIIIAACRNLDELDIYLDCLYSKELFDFNCFEIKFEVAPQVSKNMKTQEF